MDEEDSKHLEKVSEIFYQKFKESLKTTETYLNEMKFDENETNTLLCLVYEHQILSMLLSIFANNEIDDFIDSVNRIMKLFENNAKDFREYNDLFKVVKMMLSEGKYNE